MSSRVQRICFTVLVAITAATFRIAGPTVAAAPLEVDAVKSSKSLPNPLEVVGVVAKRNASAGTFSLIDREEYRKCQSVTCANFLFPVRWGGKLPSISSMVKVKGSVRDTKEGKFFIADSVEAVSK